MIKAKVYTFDKQFDGFPKREDLKLIEEDLPQLSDGEFLAEAVYLSVDPYMRAYAPRLKLRSVFIGRQVARISESKNPKFPIGKYVVGEFGWRTHTITDGSDPTTMLLLDFDGLPLSLGIGVLGRPGNTAYFGFLELCQPKPGDVVVVSGAGGAVGSHVGQIAKIKGCKVIGITGCDLKGKWLTEELGFDHFINYKTQNVTEELRIIAPDGVDCYFDNVRIVGGDTTFTVINQMKAFGRVSLCGAVSTYNDKVPKASIPEFVIVSKQLKLEGFIVWRWAERWEEGIKQNLKWIKEGKLKYRETVTEGFDNMFQAFSDMLSGKNFGKAIVKV